MKNKKILGIIIILSLILILFGLSQGRKNITEDDNIETVDENIQTEVEDENKEPTQENTFTEAEVVKVIDGDTVHVIIDGEKHRLRFVLLDAPEINHPVHGVEFYGIEATEYTREQLLGKTVYLEQDVSKTDKHGRLLAYVWLERPKTNEPTEEELAKYCFNSLLIENGYAELKEYPPDLKYLEFFKTRDKNARENKLGIYSDDQEMITEKPEEQETVADTTQGKIKGNKRSKVYHCPGQKDYDNISEKNVIYFETEEEAKDAGYKKAPQ